MSWAFAIQTLASAVAVAGLVALAAWAKIAAPRPPLDEAAARALFAEEFPGMAVGRVWVAADGRAAIGRSGEKALVVFLRGDDYVARALPWRDAAAGPVNAGVLRLAFRDIAAPAARFLLGEGASWPPSAGAAQ